MKGKELMLCNEHKNKVARCPSCSFFIDWNLFRKLCHCGEPANGYRAMSRDADVEFFCDEHFQPVPLALGVDA